MLDVQLLSLSLGGNHERLELSFRIAARKEVADSTRAYVTTGNIYHQPP